MIISAQVEEGIAETILSSVLNVVKNKQKQNPSVDRKDFRLNGFYET